MRMLAISHAIKRYNAEGLAGLYDPPRAGHPSKLTSEWKEELRLGNPLRVRVRTCGRLY